MIKKIQNISDIVLCILRTAPEARDNDELLRFKVHAEQRGFIRNFNYSLNDYVRLCISRELAGHESIRRARQKLQELHPELRGQTYRERKGLETEMRQTIRFLPSLSRQM